MSINTQRGSRKFTLTILHLLAVVALVFMFVWLDYRLTMLGKTSLDVNVLLIGLGGIGVTLGIGVAGNVKTHRAQAQEAPKA